MYAIRRVKVGRKVGVTLNVRDVSSEYCQLSKGVRLERLDRFDREGGEWLEVLIEDRRAGPAETAASRIDVNDWPDRMPPRDRRIAEALAASHTTGEVASQFDVSPSRISQKRREYFDDWHAFQRDSPEAVGTMGEQKAANPFLRVASLEQFLMFMGA